MKARRRIGYDPHAVVMNRWRWLSGSALGLVLLGGPVRAVEVVSLSVEAGKVLHRVDPMIYGHFLEHIYHSVNGGLWGELVWNRSFEECSAWTIEGERMVQNGLEANRRFVFGDPAWRDYEFTLEARKTGGAEGFLVLFRVKDENEFYWYNIGGWGNTGHALERGRAGTQRWGVISPMVKGSIASDKWYRIRVRVEGLRLRAWLDGDELLDFTDDENGHLSGAVGVGTWATQAEFRNLRVTGLDGRELFSGLPSLPGDARPFPYWDAYGSGGVSPSRVRPLNSESCAAIVAGAGETGLAQAPFSVRKGEVCRGSLWARGEAPGGLVARLLAGGRVLAQAELGVPADEWREFPVELKPSRGAREATLQVGFRGAATAWLDQVSLMPESATREGGFRPDLLAAVAALEPPVIRWPGGCYAEHYRWKDGVGPQSGRGAYPLSMWDDTDVNSYGTDEFVAMCRRIGSEPLIVVNFGQRRPKEERADWIREILEWLEYCNGDVTTEFGAARARNGHPEPYGITYWEIGNETWHMGAEAYADAVNEVAAAMREAHPGIKVIACGSGGFNLDWNRVVIERCGKAVDYLSVHHYENPDRFAEGPGAYEGFLRKTGELIAASGNSEMKIYVSEWNAQSTDWRTGLYAGGLLNVFERLGETVAIGGPALFLRHVSADQWDNAFINFDHAGWFPAPNYVVMRLWREHFGPDLLEMAGDSGKLNATCVKSADGRAIYFKCVNPDAVPVKVSLTVRGMVVAGARMEVVAPGSLKARNTLAAPDAVKPVRGRVRRSGSELTFTVPALAAAVVEITRKTGSGLDM